MLVFNTISIHYTKLIIFWTEFRLQTLVGQDIFVTTADGYQLISQNYEEVVNIWIDFIREMYPEVSDIYIQKKDLRQLLYVNFQQNADKWSFEESS